MTRDDRDIESSNPSKSFKVGDFDRLSGFFTPVWESKRRIRSESPIPASGPASSKSGAAKPATKPTPSNGVAAQPSPTNVPAVRDAGAAPEPAGAGDAATTIAAAAQPAAAAKRESSPPAKRESTPPVARQAAVTSKQPTPAAPGETAPAPARREAAAGAKRESATPAQADARAPAFAPAPSAGEPAGASDHGTPAPAAPPEASAASRVPQKLSKEPTAAPRPGPTVAARKAAEPAATKAPMATASTAMAAANTAQKSAPRESASPVPTLATGQRPSIAALKQAGPNLPAEAFLDPKPDFRAPLSKSTPAPQAERINTHQRSLRASVAATRVHEQLRSRAQPDSFEAPELQWGTETDREATAASVAAHSPAADDPHPLHLLRRLRRTIHLSTPLPEAVREMIARYGRN